MANEDPAVSHSSAELLSVTRERRGAAVLVRCSGEIDVTSVRSMHVALTAALDDATAPHPVILDLTGIGFLASAGLAELASAHLRAADQNTPLRIVATGRVVLRPLEVTGMAGTLDIRRDITSALAPLHDQAGDRPAL